MVMRSGSPKSDASTVVITPTPSPPPADRVDFAKLVPCGKAAETAFNEVVQESFQLPSDSQNRLRKLIFWEERLDEPSGSESEAAAHDVIRYYTGYFRFNVTLESLRPLGWSLGGGFGETQPTVQFPACITSAKRRNRVSDSHARFSFNNYGVLMLHAAFKRRVSLQTTSVVKRLLNESYALTSQNCVIGIGDLQYRLEYLPWASTEAFKAQLQQFMRRSNPQWQVPSSLSTVGSADCQRLDGYIIQQGFPAGSFGIVYSCLHEASGQAFAVKRIRTIRKSRRSLEAQEVEMLKHIASLENRCPWILSLVHVHDSGYESVVFLDPLLEEDFENLAFVDYADFSYMSRLEASAQICHAVAWLHENQIMHRDIKPSNAGLKSRLPVHAILFDFGCATLQLESTYHQAGTIAYLAPEVLDLKTDRTGVPYGLAADVWALGLSVVQFTCRVRRPSVTISSDQDSYVIEIRAIKEAIESEDYHVRDVLKQMIAENPQERIEAYDAATRLESYVEQKTCRQFAKPQSRKRAAGVE